MVPRIFRFPLNFLKITPDIVDVPASDLFPANFREVAPAAHKRDPISNLLAATFRMMTPPPQERLPAKARRYWTRPLIAETMPEKEMFPRICLKAFNFRKRIPEKDIVPNISLIPTNFLAITPGDGKDEIFLVAIKSRVKLFVMTILSNQ